MTSQPTTDTGASPTQERTERFGRLHALIRNDKRRQRLLFRASLVALAIVCALAAFARLYTVLPFDVWFTRELQEHPRAFVTQAMVFVSSFGYPPWSLITLVVAVLLVGALLGWKDGAYLLALTAVQGLVNAGVKVAIGRARPLDTLVNVFVPVYGNSFPSGHVMFYTVFFGFLFFLAWSRMPHSPLRSIALVLCGALVALIGPSRIILGAHWFTDVIAAYLLGLVILGFGIEFYLRALAPRAPEEQKGLAKALDQK